MNSSKKRKALQRECLRFIVCVAIWVPLLGPAQWPFDVRTTPDAQRH